MKRLNFSKLNEKIRKKTRITFREKGKNIWENLKENPEPFIYGAGALGAVISGYYLFYNFAEHNELVNGYQQAHKYITNLKDLLTTATEIKTNFPINKEILEAPINLIQENMPQIYSEEGKKILQDIYSLKDSIISNTNKQIINALENIEKPLEKLANSGKELLLFLGGIGCALGAAILGATTHEAVSNSYFRDYNASKKNTRKEYKRFKKSLQSSLENEVLSSKTIQNKITFFEKLNMENISRISLENALLEIGGIGKKSPQILRVFNKDPDKYIRNLDQIIPLVKELENADNYSQNRQRGIKRKDAFLRELSYTSDVSHSNLKRIYHAIRSIIDSKDPQIISALTNRIHSPKEIHNFLDIKRCIPKKTSEKILNYYLQTPTCPSINSLNNNYIFWDKVQDYITEKTENLNEEESIKLINNLVLIANNNLASDIIFEHSSPETIGYFTELSLTLLKNNEKILPHIAELDPEDLIKNFETYHLLYKKGYTPTPWLIQRIKNKKDQNKEFHLWEKTKKKINNGHFNPKNKLMMELEYASFYTSSKYLKKDGSYENYLKIWEGKNE